MRAKIYVGIVLILFACNGSNSQNSAKQAATACTCEMGIETDSVIFVGNVRLKGEGGRKGLLFNCAAIETGVASINDENGLNERETFIYNIRCVSDLEQGLELSEDFKYFVKEMQTQQDFFKAIGEDQKLFFEVTVEGKKIKSIRKLDMAE
ncbi:hypothetical protein [Niabella drilacis]|uniref:Lipoprotein n=1 Tax=Niabella drilacis (strain DSM 25811 / CCM 8410 / CCUG 62505 / LMG 26954 / E90) TaxID=1285928 RepID=A0A1G6TD02_NIADE|nr:hypothetical protein [Niabella drilacis]SDD26941.1 hypothetical protein SAMN04487894_107175 [Niabella drilacis]